MVVSPIKPLLVRKKVAIKSTPTVQIIRPQEPKVIRLQDLQRLQRPATNPAIVVQPKHLKRQPGVKKKTTVKHCTYDPMPGSLENIKSVQSKGRGKILVIVANGPSVSEAPLDQLLTIPNVETLTLNCPDQRIWPTTYWAFFDRSQFTRHEKFWDNYEGYIFNSTSIKRQKTKSMQFKNHAGYGWSRDLTKNIFVGRSSAYAAMQIAQWMQFAHVYIFGVDMNPDGLNGQLHFYGVNPDVDPATRAIRFQGESVYYDKAAEVLTDMERSKFTFKTDYNPWSFIQKFNHATHKNVDDIRERAQSLK